MPDSSDLPMYLAVVGFLTLLGVLVFIMPAGFSTVSITAYGVIEAPSDRFGSGDVLSYSELKNETVPTHWLTVKGFDTGGWSFVLAIDKSDNVLLYRRDLATYFTHGWWILDFYNARTGSRIADRIHVSNVDDEVYWDARSNSSKFIVKDDAVEATVWFGWDIDTYDNSTHAWENDALWMLLGVEWDDMKTGLNAWSLLSKLLFFQMPTSEVPFPLNMIIPVMIWSCVIYLMFTTILKFIESLPFT